MRNLHRPNQEHDIVGDIHGHANPLNRLLDKLGYAEIEGVFRHPKRKMVFVGDFIDRGPEQREVLRIARAMCQAGSAKAVLGNHEFNAIGWAAQSEDGDFLRSHSTKNAHQHAEFLQQFEENSAAVVSRVGMDLLEAFTRLRSAITSGLGANAGDSNPRVP